MTCILGKFQPRPGHPNDEVPGIDLPGGMETLYSLANVPKSWPLARLTIPLSAASKHLERLLEGYCMEVLVTNSNPDSQLHFVRKFAKDLVVVFAFHLAETISALFRHVLDHPSKVLFRWGCARAWPSSFTTWLRTRTTRQSCLQKNP